ncbi:hypothetical protein CPTAKMNP4_135 [Salmonella phage vB_SenM-AKM_NP4]|nr:internal head protein [Salmonella phage STP4-a]AHJ86983.1 hypothetical protein STP4a_129 [Salmonella phage STP4-a]WDR21796.1 hypothetical protein PJM34_0128 [Salmonella phage vB_SenM_UTK0003]WKV23482.1 hypothetical protein SEA1_gp0134 [Salmonella phage SEA1]WLI71757.1 hypothetical protein CPTAKMNP4_135 [Salmonella phage vB_SenM-AKM_NP4]
MKTYQEFINEAFLTEKSWPMGLSKKNTYKWVDFKGRGDAEDFENLMRNGYTFLDSNYNKITSFSKKSDIAYIETGRNSAKDITDDFATYGVIRGSKM